MWSTRLILLSLLILSLSVTDSTAILDWLADLFGMGPGSSWNSPWSQNYRPRPSFGAGQFHGGGWTGGGGGSGGAFPGSSHGGGFSGGGGSSGYPNYYYGGSKPSWLGRLGLGSNNNLYGNGNGFGQYGNRYGYNQRAEAGHMFI